MVLQVLVPGARLEGLEGHDATGGAEPVALAVRTGRRAYVARDHVLVELVGAHLDDSRLIESGGLRLRTTLAATRQHREPLLQTHRRPPNQGATVANASILSGDTPGETACPGVAMCQGAEPALNRWSPRARCSLDASVPGDVSLAGATCTTSAAAQVGRAATPSTGAADGEVAGSGEPAG